MSGCKDCKPPRKPGEVARLCDTHREEHELTTARWQADYERMYANHPVF